MNLQNIKRWYFSLGAVIIQAVFTIYWSFLFLSTPDRPRINPNDDFTSINAAIYLFGIFSLIIMGLLLIPTILLKINSDKTKKIGSVLSIIFGIIAVFILIKQLSFQGPLNSYIIIYCLQIIQAFFLLAAGRKNVDLIK